MKNVALSLLVFISVGILGAHTPSWEWVVRGGGSGSDGASIAIDSQGNQFVTGSFSGTATFGPYTLSSSGSGDIFIAKCVSTNYAIDLFFSEYIEGSSNNKVLEIFNGTGQPVNLGDYRVELYSNGSAAYGQSITLSSNLAHEDVYVIANASSIPEILALADVTHAVTLFNGDDAIALRKLSTNTIIDIIGVIGSDPGTAWNVAGVTSATLNHTLIRKPTVVEGNLDWALSAGTNATDSEWIVQAQDYIANLGMHSFNPSLDMTAAPVFAPGGGLYFSPINLTLSSATHGAAIRYTLDGSEPSETVGTLYGDPIPLSATTTVKAIAYATGYLPSPVITVGYVFPVNVSNIAQLRAQPLGATVYRLTGEAVLTFQQSYRNQKFVQDATAAILIDDPAIHISTVYNLYDGITGIIGTLYSFNGMMEFAPIADPGAATSSGNVIVPELRTFDSLTSSDQAKLIKVLDVTLDASSGNFLTTAQSIDATDPTITLVMRTFPTTDYSGTPIPDVPIPLTCLVGQFDYSMQVSPRFLDDFGALDIIVGTGTVDLDLPVNIFYGYTYSQTIYYPSELNYPAGYRIEKLYYYYNGYENCESTKDWVIWMDHTTENTFASTASWLPVASLTQVYAGENQPQQVTGGYWMEFVLNSPFIYDGVSNLVIAVDENTPGYDASSYYSNFYCTYTPGVNRSIRYYSDGTNPDPNAPPTGTLIAGLPNTKFFVAPIPTTPHIMVSPEARDFQPVAINTGHVQQFSVSNTGPGTLGIVSITYAGDPYFQLQNLPAVFPVNLTSADPAATFQVTYLPTAAGTHSGTVTITYNGGITIIELDGVCVDTRIASLPHSQNFDGVTAPALPLGWTGYKGNTGMTISTSTGYAQTTPNSVYMSNSIYTSEQLRLISPEITVPMSSFKLSFWARSGGSNYTLQVGTVSAVDGSGVFTELAVFTIPIGATWAQYTVSYATYAGTDHYLAIQHGQGDTFRSFYIDTVILDELMACDLAATALSGPSLGIAGVPMRYDVTVYNNGSATQNSYTVHLKKQGENRIASLPVTSPLEPGAYATHTLYWTPTASQVGSYSLVGEVERSEDGNASNNESSPRPVLIMPAGSYTPLVGDPLSASSTNFLPLSFLWKNSVSETIYTALEMQMSSGEIIGVAYYSNFTQNLPGKPVKIWAKNTSVTDLAAGWLDFAGYSLVFDGVIDFPIGANTIVIPFSAPLAYTGGNLALRVNRPLDAVWFSSANQFYYTVPQYGPNRSKYIYSDSTTYDPTAPAATNNLTSNIPLTRFLVTNAVPVALDAPVVTVTQSGTELLLAWAAVPGAYAYKIFSSYDPYVWPGTPLAVVWTPAYSIEMTASHKFFKVVAVSSYRGQGGFEPGLSAAGLSAPEKNTPAAGRTDNKD